MNKIYLSIFLLLIFSLNLFSQTKIDSLENQLKIVNNKEKVDVLNKLANEYCTVSPLNTIKYGQQALELSQKLEYYFGETQAQYFLGKGYSNYGNYDRAIEFYLKALKKNRENKDNLSIAACLNDIGFVYRNLSNYDKALKYHLESLKIWEDIEDKNGIASSLNSIGNIYWYLDNYNKALEYYEKTLIITEETGNKNGCAATLNNIGLVYSKLDDHKKSTEYQLKALKIFEEIGNRNAVAVTLNNIGRDFFCLNDYNNALKYYLRSLKVREEVGDKYGLSITLNNVGDVHLKQQNLEKAFLYFKRCLKLAKEINSKDLITDGYESLSLFYFAKKSYKKSLEYYKLYTAVKDSIFTEESSEKIAEMQIKYETEKKEKENEILKKDNDIQKLEINKQQNLRNSLIVISILILILFFVSYKRYLSKQKTNVILNQKNSLIEKTNKELNKKNKKLEIHEEHISLINNILQHDLTNNLSITSSAIRLFRKSNDIKMIDEIMKSTQKSVELIRNMQNLEKFLNLHSALKLYFLNDTIDTIVKNFDTINFNIIGRSKILADNSLSSVFENIIGNAVVHGKADSIDINILRKEKICEVRIADNGIGIPEKIRESIFDEGFKYGKDAHTGMGLFIVKKAMENYGGTISVENNEPKGTIFVLTFRRMG